ncbi:hypothetical protein NL676_032695 [Syzygium grande]|nr:hypothetical protein NL676_032695 [Syzygium grande]
MFNRHGRIALHFTRVLVKGIALRLWDHCVEQSLNVGQRKDLHWSFVGVRFLRLLSVYKPQHESTPDEENSEERLRESRFRELRNERIFLETSKGGSKYDVRSSLHDRPASAPSAGLLRDGADDEFLVLTMSS